MIDGPGHFNGLAVYVSPNALQETKERLFPESKHRSRRIHKKLVKRFGGEFRKVPAMWRTPAGIVAHPVKYAELVAAATKEGGLRRYHGPASISGVYDGNPFVR